jgi:hypothetical protein
MWMEGGKRDDIAVVAGALVRVINKVVCFLYFLRSNLLPFRATLALL